MSLSASTAAAASAGRPRSRSSVVAMTSVYLTRTTAPVRATIPAQASEPQGGSTMAIRTASAEWKGDLPSGTGRFEGASGQIEGAYSFTSRFTDEGGTNPEE